MLSNKNNITYAFDDSWESIDHYKEFLRKRFFEVRRILTEDGTFFVHCDRNASHHIRLILDEIFGAKYFQSEIIWRYKRWSNAKKGLLNNHQTIFMYSKTSEYKFNMILEEYSATTNVDQIMQERIRNENNKSAYKTDENGEAVLAAPKKGVPLSDVWDIPFLNPKAKERVGYPTQKPIALLERIINISTDENDIVLDPFCGSGTTAVASKLLKRNYIGFDISEEAVSIAKKRLENPVKSESDLLKKGIDAYKHKSQFEISILKSLDATIVQRNKAVDGYLKYNFKSKPIPVRIQKEGETIEDIIGIMNSSAKTKTCKLKVIIKVSEQGLFESIIPNDFLCLNSFDLSVNQFIDKNSDI
ncbi:DNA-methyltransferase [Hutsoniella sourekii]|uniref:DNA-methyltransferase n=1 Tax=Hutsoniella sourekii TaxID=87650 RepID=UPI0004B99150